MLIYLLSFTIGYLTFPILFYFQKLFGLPVPSLKDKNFHLHHSFYGLNLIIIGLIALILGKHEGLHLALFGIGFIVHHEVSEPGLTGIGKFIYKKKNE